MIVGLYSNNILSSIRNCSTVFHSHYQGVRVPDVLCTPLHLVLSGFLILAILVGVSSTRWFFNIFLMFIYFWDREKQSMNGGGSERGTHRIWNRLQALSCQQSRTRGSNSWTARSWPEPKSAAQPTESPRRPCRYSLNDPHTLSRSSKLCIVFIFCHSVSQSVSQSCSSFAEFSSVSCH